MLVSFALVPPPELTQRLAGLRAQFDPEHAVKTIPHLTVKQPFETARFEQVVGRVAALRLRAVSIELREVGVFETAQFGSVLHLHAPRTGALDALHTALLTALADLSQSGPTPEAEERVLYPHLTLAQGLTPEAARAALAALKLELPITFQARELVMGVRDDHDVWHRPHSWRLQS